MTCPAASKMPGLAAWPSLACMQRPMRNDEPTEVYDPFVGSGTTIIAAEQLGRRCYAMDIDPRYVQVAKERWERLTGQEAVKADG